VARLLHERRESAAAGAVGGIAAGLLTGALLANQHALAGAGFHVHLAESGFTLFVLASTLLGAVYGALARFSTDVFAPDVAGGLLLGLVSFILGPLTLVPIAAGSTVRWSLPQASAAFPQLVAALGGGAMTGFGFHVALGLWRQRHPLREPTGDTATRRRVVILGGGFGGVGAAQRLERVFSNSADVDITMVSSSNYLLFTPMLAEVASSALRAEHISTPIRASCPRTRFRRAEVEDVDPAARSVRIRCGDGRLEALPYDDLVVALGSVPTFRGLPGLKEHAFTLKSLDDAARLRNQALELLERADGLPTAAARRPLLTFVVAGGGFAGVEMIAELFDLVHGVLHYYPSISAADTRFVLVHSGEGILPELNEKLGRFARERLEARGIEFALGARLAAATAHSITLSDGREIETRTLVWTAGNRPNPLLDRLPFERTQTGTLIADATLRLRGYDDIWSAGDCASIPDPARAGSPCPPTAQHALRQGKTVAENIARVSRGREPQAFHFRQLGILVALGHRTAVAEIRGRQFTGFAAWLLWRGIYLMKLPGLERKIRVAADWAMDLVFPRDIVVTTSTPTVSDTIGASSPDWAPPAVTGGS
jgi:NADH:ubiquinone reductase (H+-translocating)